jgi:hypothetical protein
MTATKNPNVQPPRVEITKHAARYETSQNAKAVGNAKPAPNRLSGKGGRR